MARSELVAEMQINYPWMPRALINVWLDAFSEHGDTDDAWQEVRNGEGREVYDREFPGNRRDDGTLRLNEPLYLSTVAQYRNTLAQRGLDPDVFEDRYSSLISNEVSADEFESRVAAINEGIAQRSEEIQRAFAEASGINDFSEEAVLATALDPDGVGRELLERRISVAQVRGTAAEFGFNRSQERIESVLSRVDVSEAQARDFFGSLESRLQQFNTISQAARGQRGVTAEDIEDAGLLNEEEAIRNLSRLLSRNRAMFSTQRGRIRADQSGAFVGLTER